MKYYLGVVEKDAASSYGMWFPDMPGCLPAADELDELPRVAAEILRQHMEALESNGRLVPEPRPLAEVLGDADVTEATRRGAVAVLIPLERNGRAAE